MKKECRVLILLTGILTIYAGLMAFLSIRNHELYQTFGWDLGFFDQLIWQASRGNLNFVSTIGNINLLGDHFQPVIYLLAPLYWIWSDVRVLLIVQALLVTGAAIPLYFLAKKKLHNEFISFSIVISYLLFSGTQFTITNEFHQSAFIPLLLSLGFYWMETGKRNWGIISILSLLLVKEEMGLLVAAIGLMYIFRKQVKTGILLTVAGLFGFYILINSIIPAVSSQNNYIHYGYGSLGETPAEVAKSVINNPVAGFRSLIEPKIKLEQVGASIISFGGLPLLSPVGLIPVFQNYAVRFIDDRNTHRWLNNNHYSAPLGPLLAYATILAFGKFKSRKLPAVYLAAMSIVVALVLRLPVWSLFKSQLYFTPQWAKNIDSIVKLVPANASVAANNSVFPHISQRDKIYLLPEINDAEYVVMDLEDGPNKYSPLDFSQAVLLSERLESESWDKIAVSGKSVIFKRPKGL
ncbi:MAG: DUF2079 domain-containing protein [Patescibacteria group bacterium]